MNAARAFGTAAAVAFILAAGIVTASAQGLARRPVTPEPAADLEDVLYLEFFCGRVVIEMFPAVAPLHVERMRTLARDGFYDGVVFHRVIPGFVAQGGDPTGTGTGGSPLPNLPAEFNEIPYQRGTVGMARALDPDSANSQFFIAYDRLDFLDGQYTVWGEVVSGMECIDQLAVGEPPTQPTPIISMRVAADVEQGGPK